MCREREGRAGGAGGKGGYLLLSRCYCDGWRALGSPFLRFGDDYLRLNYQFLINPQSAAFFETPRLVDVSKISVTLYIFHGGNEHVYSFSSRPL